MEEPSPKKRVKLDDKENEKGDAAVKVHFPAVVELNVGGHKFTTLLQTLTKEPDSMLAALFSGRHTVNKDENGRFFIDADGAMFGHILNFLRVEQLPPTEVSSQVCRYASYFGIQSLVDRLQQNEDVIEINVGGRCFTTHVSVLRKETGSKLAQMFCDQQSLPKSPDGRYFIDADGDVFFHILHYLRHKELPPAEFALQVYKAANVFGIDSLADKLKKFSSLNMEKIRSLYESQSDQIKNNLDDILAQTDGEAMIHVVEFDADETSVASAFDCHPDTLLIQGVNEDKKGEHLVRLIIYELEKFGWKTGSWYKARNCGCDAESYKLKLKLPHSEARVNSCAKDCHCRN